MDELVLQVLTRTGPLVILAGLFLLWDFYRTRFSAQRWAQKDREFASLVEQVTRALQSNADAMREFGERMATRPCLWEQNQQQLAQSFERLAERIVEAVSDRKEAKP